jgi:Mg-chelatase subunit ChlI
MKLALLLNVIDPKIGGVLLTGQQGTGKTTAVRALVDILPEISVHEGCQFQCDITWIEGQCDFCRDHPAKLISKPITLVNLPLGATEEMVIGSLDIEKIIREGKRAILPGLLAKAHRGILYIDEINLLQDHLVDILLDVSASGINIIEREGISLSHPSAFILVGSMNPEEGDLRPQISDRLGLEVPITAPNDPKVRSEITRRVIQYQDHPEEFCDTFSSQQIQVKQQIMQARTNLLQIAIPSDLYNKVAGFTIDLGLYSQRTDLTFLRCARAIAAWNRHLQILFEHRVKRFQENVSMDELETKFAQHFTHEA